MKIALLGCGVVGSGVKKIIDSMENEIKILKILVKNIEDITDNRMTTDIREILDSDIDLVVECIGGIEIPFDYIMKALKNKKHVVTSNKKVMAKYYKEIINTAKENDVCVAFEASVGGGIPWLENIRHIKRIDEIFSFEGIFNGTTNYILDNMVKNGKDFKVALNEAQKLGYAEQDPTDDIKAYDVTYKCCLSSNAIWNTCIDSDKIISFGIENVSKKDIDFSLKKDRVPKLIGRGIKKTNKLSVFVLPVFIKRDKNIANVGRNLNCLKVKSQYLGESSYIGEGAGMFSTAHAVVQDILSIYYSHNISTDILEEFFVENEYRSSFYIRTKKIDIFSEITSEKIDEETIITECTDVRKIDELIKRADDNTLFVAEMIK